MAKYETKTADFNLQNGNFISESLQLFGNKAIAEVKAASISGSVTAKLQLSLNGADFVDIPESAMSLDQGDGVYHYYLGPLSLPEGVYIRSLVNKEQEDAEGIVLTLKLLSDE